MAGERCSVKKESDPFKMVSHIVYPTNEARTFFRRYMGDTYDAEKGHQIGFFDPDYYHFSNGKDLEVLVCAPIKNCNLGEPTLFFIPRDGKGESKLMQKRGFFRPSGKDFKISQILKIPQGFALLIPVVCTGLGHEHEYEVIILDKNLEKICDFVSTIPLGAAPRMVDGISMSDEVVHIKFEGEMEYVKDVEIYHTVKGLKQIDSICNINSPHYKKLENALWDVDGYGCNDHDYGLGCIFDFKDALTADSHKTYCAFDRKDDPEYGLIVQSVVDGANIGRNALVVCRLGQYAGKQARMILLDKDARGGEPIIASRSTIQFFKQRGNFLFFIERGKANRLFFSACKLNPDTDEIVSSFRINLSNSNLYYHEMMPDKSMFSSENIQDVCFEDWAPGHNPPYLTLLGKHADLSFSTKDIVKKLEYLQNQTVNNIDYDCVESSNLAVIPKRMNFDFNGEKSKVPEFLLLQKPGLDVLKQKTKEVVDKDNSSDKKKESSTVTKKAKEEVKDSGKKNERSNELDLEFFQYIMGHSYDEKSGLHSIEFSRYGDDLFYHFSDGCNTEYLAVISAKYLIDESFDQSNYFMILHSEKVNGTSFKDKTGVSRLDKDGKFYKSKVLKAPHGYVVLMRAAIIRPKEDRFDCYEVLILDNDLNILGDFITTLPLGDDPILDLGEKASKDTVHVTIAGEDMEILKSIDEIKTFNEMCGIHSQHFPKLKKALVESADHICSIFDFEGQSDSYCVGSSDDGMIVSYDGGERFAHSHFVILGMGQSAPKIPKVVQFGYNSNTLLKGTKIQSFYVEKDMVFLLHREKGKVANLYFSALKIEKSDSVDYGITASFRINLSNSSLYYHKDMPKDQKTFFCDDTIQNVEFAGKEHSINGVEYIRMDGDVGNIGFNIQDISARLKKLALDDDCGWRYYADIRRSTIGFAHRGMKCLIDKEESSIEEFLEKQNKESKAKKRSEKKPLFDKTGALKADALSSIASFASTSALEKEQSQGIQKPQPEAEIEAVAPVEMGDFQNALIRASIESMLSEFTLFVSEKFPDYAPLFGSGFMSSLLRMFFASCMDQMGRFCGVDSPVYSAMLHQLRLGGIRTAMGASLDLASNLLQSFSNRSVSFSEPEMVLQEKSLNQNSQILQ